MGCDSVGQSEVRSVDVDEVSSRESARILRRERFEVRVLQEGLLRAGQGLPRLP